MLLSTLHQILQLFDTKERWRLFFVVLVLLTTATLEVAGLASVMPFLALAADPEMALQNDLLRFVYEAGGFSSQRSFLIAIGFVVLVVFGFSNLMAVFASWRIARFGADLQHELSVRLLRAYIAQPYTTALKRNTSVLGSNLLGEIPVLVGTVIVPTLHVFARAMVAILIVGLLIVVDPALALGMTAVFGLAYYGLSVGLRSRQLHIGKRRKKSNAERYKAGIEALAGIKEIRITGTENEFLERFSKPSRIHSLLYAKESILGELPRYLLETVAFGSVIVTILAYLLLNYDLSSILPLLGLYAVAGTRLLPALQKIYHGVARLRMGKFAFDEIHRDLSIQPESLPAPTKRRLKFERSIALEHVWFRYDEEQEWVLRGVSLEIRKNSVVAFVGPTGAGKSTLADLLLGLLSPVRGRILIDGRPLTPDLLAQWRRRIGYVPQQIYLFDASIASNVAFGLSPEQIDRERVRQVLEAASLDEFVDSLPAGMDTLVGDRGVRLSGGQRQRIGIARALYRDPEVVVLDEATSALDGVTESSVMQAISRLEGVKTVILIAHRLTTVQRCDEIFLLENGQVTATGGYAELITSNDLFRRMAGIS